jgi:hypothetical protein
MFTRSILRALVSLGALTALAACSAAPGDDGAASEATDTAAQAVGADHDAGGVTVCHNAHGKVTKIVVCEEAARNLVAHGDTLADCLGVCGGTALCGACPTNGAFHCSSATTFEKCDHGTWDAVFSCGAGTRCVESGAGLVVCEP